MSDLSLISYGLFILLNYSLLNNRGLHIKYIVIFYIKIVLFLLYIALYGLKKIQKFKNCLYKLFSCKKDNNSLLENNLISELNINNSLINKNENSKFKNEYLEMQKKTKIKDNITTKLINITKIYTTYKNNFCCCKTRNIILQNLNLGLESNEKFGLLGFNGSGKSTLIKTLINGIEYDGEIY